MRRLADRIKPVTVFVRAAAAEPRGINSRISLAVLLEKGHRLDEARSAVAECLAIDPRDEQARYFSAVLDRRQGKITEAENGLRDLIGSEPSASLCPLRGSVRTGPDFGPH